MKHHEHEEHPAAPAPKAEEPVTTVRVDGELVVAADHDTLTIYYEHQKSLAISLREERALLRLTNNGLLHIVREPAKGYEAK